MRADGDVVTGQELDDAHLLRAALELHHARTALLHQAHGILQCLLRRGIAHERQIGDEERPVQAARHGPRVIDHVVDRDRHRGVVSLDHHAERVADQHQIDAGLIEQHRKTGVVTGERGDGLAVLAHAPQRRQRDGGSGGIPQLQLRVHGRKLTESMSA